MARRLPKTIVLAAANRILSIIVQQGKNPNHALDEWAKMSIALQEQGRITEFLDAMLIHKLVKHAIRKRKVKLKNVYENLSE